MDDFPCPCSERGSEKKELNKRVLMSASPSNTLIAVRKKRKSHYLRLSVCRTCNFIGQNQRSAGHFHVLISIRCFALTVYGWMWVQRRRDTGLIHLRTFPSWFGIFKRKLRTNGCMLGFINLDIFWHTYISSFVHMQMFSVDSTRSFMHEAPGLLKTPNWLVITSYSTKIPNV